MSPIMTRELRGKLVRLKVFIKSCWAQGLYIWNPGIGEYGFLSFDLYDGPSIFYRNGQVPEGVVSIFTSDPVYRFSDIKAA